MDDRHNFSTYNRLSTNVNAPPRKPLKGMRTLIVVVLSDYRAENLLRAARYDILLYIVHLITRCCRSHVSLRPLGQVGNRFREDMADTETSRPHAPSRSLKAGDIAGAEVVNNESVIPRRYRHIIRPVCRVTLRTQRNLVIDLVKVVVN